MFRSLIDDALLGFIPRGSPIAIFDYPNHPNVGDSAIWVGEQDFLRCNRLGPVIRVDSCRLRSKPLPSLPGNCIIMIHGGGNLGDLWAHHQQFREQVLSKYSNNIILQLPQTIYFKNSNNLHKFVALANSRTKFTLFVRDNASYDLAKSNGLAKVLLCPDMALYMAKTRRRNHSTVDIFLLLRTDSESALASMPMPGNQQFSFSCGDWLTERHTTLKILCHKIERLQDILDKWLHKIELAYSQPSTAKSRWMPVFLLNNVNRLINSLKNLIFYRLARARVERGILQLGQGKIVISDRLHAFILCYMLDIPVISLENNYGKISAVSSTWPKLASSLIKAKDVKDAISLAKQRLAK